MFAFDVAYEMGRAPITKLFGQPVQQFKVDTSKRAPKHSFFFRPQMITLPVAMVTTPHGTVEVEYTIKVLPIGAISITVCVPFEVDQLKELVAYHDLHCGEKPLTVLVRELAERLYIELRPNVVRPVEYLADEEAYTVFCVESASLLDGTNREAEEWLQKKPSRRGSAPDPGTRSSEAF